MSRLQPNPDTREKQIQTWIKYIMEYCKSNGLSEVNVNSFPLFENRSIESLRFCIVAMNRKPGSGDANQTDERIVRAGFILINVLMHRIRTQGKREHI